MPFGITVAKRDAVVLCERSGARDHAGSVAQGEDRASRAGVDQPLQTSGLGLEQYGETKGD